MVVPVISVKGGESAIDFRGGLENVEVDGRIVGVFEGGGDVFFDGRLAPPFPESDVGLEARMGDQEKTDRKAYN